MVVGSSRSFSAAVERIVKSQPHGFQKELAKRIKISPQYMSDLMSGRKLWPDEHKDRVAHQLGYSVADLLLIGQVIVESGQFFPYIKEVRALTPYSEDRADWIMKRAGHDEGIGDVRFLMAPAVKIWAYGLIGPYLERKETDADLYERTRATCKRIRHNEE